MIYRLKYGELFRYPFVKEQLRTTFPNVSFPFPISDETAAEFGCLPVQTIERPEHDPRTQRIEEGDPEELSDGSLRQVLTVRDATAEEIAAWDESNRPEPDWGMFKSTLLASGNVNQALANAMSIAPAAVISIPASLMALTTGGDYADFLACWTALRNMDLISQSLLDEMIAVATQCNLPQELIDALSGG